MIEFASQALNVKVDHVRTGVVPIIPHVLGDFLAGGHGHVLPAQVLEQRVLACGRFDVPAIYLCLPGKGIECESSTLEVFREYRKCSTSC